MYYTDNPVADAERYLRDQDDALARLPKCELCGEPIQQERAVYIDGAYYCDECLHGHRVCID